MRTHPYLASILQWVLVLLAPRTDSRTEKIPCSPSGMPANAHDPGNWMSFDQAVALARSLGPQFTVGLVITDKDDLFAIDIDHARQPDGSWSPIAHELVAALPGGYVEVSQSSQGLHIWGRHPNPPPHKKRNIPLNVECYTEARFICIGTPLEVR